MIIVMNVALKHANFMSSPSIIYNFSAYNTILVGQIDIVITSIIVIISLVIYLDMKF